MRTLDPEGLSRKTGKCQSQYETPILLSTLYTVYYQYVSLSNCHISL